MSAMRVTFLASVLVGAVALSGTAMAGGGGYKASQEAAMPTGKTIVETAAANESFDTLVAAVQAAGLAETLSSSGPFTVFAPTDEAFAALPEGTMKSLLSPENKGQLVEVLTYHVVPGKMMSSDLAGKQLAATTVNGAPLPVDATSGASRSAMLPSFNPMSTPATA